MRNLQVLSRLSCRAISTSGRRGVSMGQSATSAAAGGSVPTSAGYRALQLKQQAWTKNDGLMVWQKRGTVDLIQVRALECLAAVTGVAIAAHFLMMIFPKRGKE